MPERPASFDPYSILQALDQRRVDYVVIGAFARVLQGTEEVTRGIDIVPSMRAENLGRLRDALQDLGATELDGRTIDVDEATADAVVGKNLAIEKVDCGVYGGLTAELFIKSWSMCAHNDACKMHHC